MKRFSNISFRCIVLTAAVVMLSAGVTSCRRLPAYLTGERIVARVGKAELTAGEVAGAVHRSRPRTALHMPKSMSTAGCAVC